MPSLATTSLGRDFDRFWLAAASSNLGDGIRLGALPLLAISLTDDARLIAMITAANLVPWLLLGPLGGAVVDRVDRKRLILIAQLGRAVVVGVLALLVALDAATIWLAIVCAFVLGAGEILADTTAQAAVPQLVDADQLDQANGRIGVALLLLDQVVGVALGAVLFAAAAGLPFAIDALTFLIAAALLTTIRRPLQGERTIEPRSYRSDIADGARFLVQHRFLRSSMAAIATSNFAGNVAFGVFVVLVVDELGASEVAFGLVLSIGAVGGVLGASTARRLVGRFGRRTVMSVAPSLLVVSYLINAAATELWMASASFFVSSTAIGCANVPGQSVRQAVTPERLLGRVVATFRTVGFGVAPLGALLGGVVTEATGVRIANLVAAALGFVSWLMLLGALRHLDAALTEARSTA
ncbi:MAG: MFS transporter [Actinomycetota bacterium]